MEDGDDLVQKGYGWLLKEESRIRMPRTALRYAIEKMPKKLKAEAMKK